MATWTPPGKRNRIITIQTSTEAVDAYGGQCAAGI
jgi:hypothetical protein